MEHLIHVLTKGSVLVTILSVDMPINKLSPRDMCTPTVYEFPVPRRQHSALVCCFFLVTLVYPLVTFVPVHALHIIT